MIETRWAKTRFGGTNGGVAEELPLLEITGAKKTNRAGILGIDNRIGLNQQRRGREPRSSAALVWLLIGVVDELRFGHWKPMD
ncbi:hypothetical protein U1Q18_016361 [Sarracenia purpurea var. burkii]